MAALNKKAMLLMAGIIPLLSITALSDQAIAQSRSTNLNGGEVTIVRGESRDQIWIKTKNGSTIVVNVDSDGSTTTTNESADGDRTTTNTNTEGDQTTSTTNNDNNQNGK